MKIINFKTYVYILFSFIKSWKYVLEQTGLKGLEFPQPKFIVPEIGPQVWGKIFKIFISMSPK